MKLECLVIEIRPIRNDDDSEADPAEIDRQFEAEPGTPEGDRSEVLVMLVEGYEPQHYPIPEPDPIDAIEYVMDVS